MSGACHMCLEHLLESSLLRMLHRESYSSHNQVMSHNLNVTPLQITLACNNSGRPAYTAKFSSRLLLRAARFKAHPGSNHTLICDTPNTPQAPGHLCSSFQAPVLPEGVCLPDVVSGTFGGDMIKFFAHACISRKVVPHPVLSEGLPHVALILENPAVKDRVGRTATL